MALLIIYQYRSVNHDTTRNAQGQHVPDPDGEHITFAYKNERMVRANTHVTSHAYHYGKPDYIYKAATFDYEKRDDIPRRDRGPCWPEDDQELDYLGNFPFRDGILLDLGCLILD